LSHSPYQSVIKPAGNSLLTRFIFIFVFLR